MWSGGIGYAATILAVAIQAASALRPGSSFRNGFNPGDAPQRTASSKLASTSSSVNAYTFSVPVDHFPNDSQYEPHSSDFYPVRYFLQTQFYRPGGPVIVVASGETSAEDRVSLLNEGIGSLLANATGGLVLAFEHRYYGASFPVPDLSLANYRFLTTEQAAADLAYFAKNVKFPGFEGTDLTASATPWILYGGSYGGAFAALTRKLHPDAIWGSIASSAVVEAVVDYWAFNEAARLFSPGNCGGVMGNMTDVVDQALFSGNSNRVAAVKTLFGSNSWTSNADFGNSIRHPGEALQGESWVHGEGSTQMEDYCNVITSPTLEYNLESSRPTAEQLVKDAGYPVSAATQLLNYVGLQTSSSQGKMQGKMRRAPRVAKRSTQLDDGYSWFYQVCTQWGYFITGSGVPKNIKGLVSRAVTLDYVMSGCQSQFGITTPPNVDSINQHGGTNFSYPRVALTDGKQDPWRAATVHKIGANPGRQSTTENPYILIDYGTHHWDQYDVPASQYQPGYPPQQIVDVHNQELAFVKAWIDEFHASKKSAA